MYLKSNMTGKILAVHAKGTHAFSKETRPYVDLVAGHGVVSDAHYGNTVKHRSRIAKDPAQPNLRQVHLMHGELFAELATKGLKVAPGQMGENITTDGLDLLARPEGTILRIGSTATLQLTGLRNPCAQIEAFMPGLLAAVLDRSADGELIRKAGVMSIVLQSGRVHPGDAIAIEHPPGAHAPLRPV